MPGRRRLEGARGAQHQGVAVARPDHLEADRQAVRGQPAGHRETRHAGKVEGVERPGPVVVERRAAGRIDPRIEGRHRHCRGEQDVVLLHEPGQQRADAPLFHLGVLHVHRAVPVGVGGVPSHRLVEQRATVGRHRVDDRPGRQAAQHVIGLHGIVDRRIDFGDLGTELAEHLGRCPHRSLDLRMDVDEAEPRAQRDAQALHTGFQARQIVAAVVGQALPVARVGPAQHIQTERQVANRARHRADMAPGPAPGRLLQRHAAEGRLQPRDTAEGGGNTDRAALVAAQRQRRHAGGHRDAAAAADEPPVVRCVIPGVAGDAGQRIVVRPPSSHARRCRSCRG